MRESDFGLTIRCYDEKIVVGQQFLALDVSFWAKRLKGQHSFLSRRAIFGLTVFFPSVTR